jgi:alcohol dehydrogenase, propanol-preferring
MLAARLHAVGEPLRLEEVPLPEPVGTQVRIRVAGCGMCRTDLHIAQGVMTRVELPRTLGHEIAGWVDTWGEDAGTLLRRARLHRGDAVVVYGGWGCGACRQCHAGQEQRCVTGRAPGFQEDGGYAEAVLVPHPRHLFGLGSMEVANAGPLADAGATPYRAVRRAMPWLEGGARVVLLGLGGLGQFALQFLRRLPDLEIAVNEIDPEKLSLAAELGADIGLLNADASLVVDGLGGPPDVVFDLVGRDESLELGAELVAPGGLLMLVGEGGGQMQVGFQRPAVESWVTTTAWASIADVREVVRLARRGALRWSVEAVPLADIGAAMERLQAGSVPGRLVVVPTVTG